MKIDIRTTAHPDNYKVYLNGKEVELAVAADSKAGTVTILEIDWREKCRTGKDVTIPDPDSPYGYRCIELKGDVRIEKLKEDLPKDESGWHNGDFMWDPFCGCVVYEE